jgi:Tol biopolymer transport system component
VATRTRGRPSGLAGCVVAAAVVALVSPPAAKAAFPGNNGRIAFTAGVVDRGETVWSRIETVLPSGRGRRVLGICAGDEGCLDSDPTWSPSGRRLAFVQGPAWRGRLAIVRKDGTGLRQLPQLTESDGQPAWSRDGRQLAFIGLPDGPRLYTVHRDGTALRRVTSRWAFSPAWSLTGTIAYTHDDDPYRAAMPDDGIYTTRPDGSRQRLLIRDRYNAAAPSSPDWSPHGRRIAFAFADATNPDIHVAEATGHRDRRLTRRSGTQPAWSPDGRYIAFIRHGDLYVMRSDGSGLRLVLDGGTLDSGEEIQLGSPSWQPLPR